MTNNNYRKKNILMALLLTTTVVQFILLTNAYKGYFTSLITGSKFNTQSESQFKEVVNVKVIHKTSFTGYTHCHGKVRALRDMVVKCPSIPQLQTLTVKKIHFKVGQTIREGDLLVEFDATQINFKIEVAQKLVEECKEKLDRAQQVKGGGISQMNFNLAKIEYEKAVAERDLLIEASKALMMRAPISGYAGSCQLINKEVVEPNKRICDIVDKSVFIIEFHLDSDSERILHKTVNPAVYINTISSCPEEYEAYIDGVEQSIDPNTGKIRVIAKLKNNRNTQNLKHGINVQARIEKPTKHNIFVVPKKVLFEEFGNYFVCAVIFGNNGRETRVVKVDLVDSDGERCAIDSPELTEGALLICEGIIKRDGIPVVIDEIID